MYLAGSLFAYFEIQKVVSFVTEKQKKEKRVSFFVKPETGPFIFGINFFPHIDLVRKIHLHLLVLFLVLSVNFLFSPLVPSFPCH